MIDSWKGADLLFMPTVATGTPKREALLRRGPLGSFLAVNPWITYTAFWNWTGQPALSLPAGRDGYGLPRGVQLIGARGADPARLALGAQLERAHPWADDQPIA